MARRNADQHCWEQAAKVLAEACDIKPEGAV